MSKLSLSLPWRILFHIALLFAIAWWIEDCLIYYIDWKQFVLIRILVSALAAIHFVRFFDFFSQQGVAVVHGIALTLAKVVWIIRTYYARLPESWRDLGVMRFAAWCGTTLVATFNATAIANFWVGLEWLFAKALQVLIALNGGFWIHNSMRRLTVGVRWLIRYPVQFYADRSDEEGRVAGANPNEADLSEGASPNGNRNNRTRRREYVQFFQGHVERIGIILAGGGAKGAYQAGALKAIHEFLREYNALYKVKMIAGTSIGAWNAMFWLGDMIGGKHPDRAGLESWWKNLDYRKLVEFPWLYIPFWSGSFLRSTPWRDSFEQLFKGNLDEMFGRIPPTHFYFTRTDVNDGFFKYSTNWAGIGDRLDAIGKDKNDDYRFFDVIAGGDDALKQTADALFASIDLAPVFPHSRIGDGVLEDGGVLDNLPFRFGAPVEDCDLIFVLPLDAPLHDRNAANHGVLRRVMRVADIRQSAQEAQILKTADIINRFAQRMERLAFDINALESEGPVEGIAAEAVERMRDEIAQFNSEYKLLYIFTVCPASKLELGTYDFWKRRKIQDSFDLMYLQTKRELQNRLFEDVEPEDPHIVLVDGEVPKVDSLPQPLRKRPSDL